MKPAATPSCWPVSPKAHAVETLKTGKGVQSGTSEDLLVIYLVWSKPYRCKFRGKTCDQSLSC